MPAAFKIGLFGAFVLVIGFVAWTLNTSDAQKSELPWGEETESRSEPPRLVSDPQPQPAPTGTPTSTPPRSGVTPGSDPDRASRPPSGVTRIPQTNPMLPPAVEPRLPAETRDEPLRPRRAEDLADRTPAEPRPQPTQPPIDQSVTQPASTPSADTVRSGPEVPVIGPTTTPPSPSPLASGDSPLSAPRDTGSRAPTTDQPTRPGAGQPVAGDVKIIEEYTIQDNDYLITIAERYYGDGALWPAIKLANPRIDENRLFVGNKLKIPTREEAQRLVRAGQSAPATAARPADRPTTRESTPPPSGRTYVVGEGDTLTRIARNVLKDENRWREIFELNRDKLATPDRILVGTKLKLPEK